MTIQELRCFLEVADQLSYTRAAEKLLISQPVVSRHISLLEKELDIPLFDRSVRRSVVLTEHGKKLTECLKRCRDDFNMTIKEINMERERTPIFFHLPECTTIPFDVFSGFEQMRKQFSNTYSTFFSSLQDSYQHVLEEGHFLIAPKDSLPFQPSVKSFELSTKKESYYLLCAVNHVALQSKKASHASSAPLSQFADSPLFLHKNLSSDYAEQMISYARKATGGPPEILRLESTDSIMAYLLSGLGYTIVPAWSSYLNSSTYCSFPLPFHSTIVLSYRKDAHLTSVAKEFINGLKQHCQRLNK